MSKDILDRIQKLLALAGSPYEEEARTSALMAVRMMAKHGIELRVPVGPSESGRSARDTDAPVVRVIASKFDGLCRLCGGSYRTGQRVAWTKGKGAAHLDCHDRATRGGRQ